MCKLCNSGRSIILNYNGKYQEALKTVNNYLGENCCMDCFYCVCKRENYDLYIIRRLYRTHFPYSDRQNNYISKYRKNNKEAMAICSAKYREENQDRIKKYRDENKEKAKQQRIYRKKLKLQKETA